MTIATATTASSFENEITEFVSRWPAKAFIGGKLVDAADGRTFEVEDPGSGRVIASVAFGGAAEIDLAVRGARESFEDGRWADLEPKVKERLLMKVADLIDSNAADLAFADTVNMGAPLGMTSYGAGSAAELFRYYAGWPTKIRGALPQRTPDILSYVRREPLGVIGGITPWNGPAASAAVKIAPALACGNSIVIKPSELSPLSAVRLAELCLEAGIPEGVVNVVPGDGSTGAALVEHPDVDAIAFTGSVETGKRILASSVGTLKRVGLELGGKSPNIVFADASFDDAIMGSMQGVFGNTGQLCIAGSRLFVEASVFEDFVARIVELLPTWKMGHGLAPDVTMGPVASKKQQARVKAFIEGASAEGATLRGGGGVASEGGYFVEPTVFTDVSPDMQLYREEVFGPVVAVTPFDDVAQVVREANNTPYGLAAGIWTNNLSRAHRVAAQLKAGVVWVNTYSDLDPTTPFGGFKQSGLGRELGEESLDLYTESKSVVVKI